MREAIRLSRKGMEEGHGGPFGAVIVRNKEIIGSGFNRVTSTNDSTAHAETVAIRNAEQAIRSFSLQGCDLYTSCQPCPKCLGDALWARIRKIFYAATEKDAAEIGFDDSNFYKVFNVDFHRVRMPKMQLLREEARTVMRQWLKKHNRVKY